MMHLLAQPTPPFVRHGLTAAIACLIALPLPPAAAASDQGFVSIFDGETLENWDGNPNFWRVEEGSITGQTTADNPTNGNTFIVWRGGLLRDFELKLQYRIVGGNSGIQYRSFEVAGAPWVVGGYQADFEAGDRYSGILYGERYRGILGDRGQKTVIGTDHKPQVVGSVGDSDAIGKAIRKEDWNDYHIIAKGFQFEHRINGVTSVMVTDDDTEMRRPAGVLALQLHAGPAMKVQFRNLQVKHLANEAEQAAWLDLEGQGDGPGRGKRVVLVSGDEEYRSEETLPQLAKILARRHGFDCRVAFAIDPETGEINPNEQRNIPGLEALADADAMVLFTRFRNLPADQMKYIDEFVKAGKPVIGIRTATHGFKVDDGPYAHWTFNAQQADYADGFGRVVLGETWINHHGHHGHESTRGVPVAAEAQHPVLKGVDDVWGPTDVYGVRLPLPERCRPLMLGQVLAGMQSDSPPVEGAKNDPMMPIAWVQEYQVPGGSPGRAFTTTMGASQDFANAGVRRLLVNAVYWATGLESQIPSETNVDLVGVYQPSPFKFGGFQPGVRPSDHR